MLKRIDPKDLDGNVFSMLSEQWMLVTAGTAEDCNTMTAAWGGLGYLWRRPTAMCVIRPQRHTFGYMERSDCFTLAFFGEEHREHLTLCGRTSGRDVDKVKACGFTVKTAECGAPYFEEAELVLVCRKCYAQDLEENCFTDGEVRESCYPEKDYHRMYIGEIVEVLKNV